MTILEGWRLTVAKHKIFAWVETLHMDAHRAAQNTPEQ